MTPRNLHRIQGEKRLGTDASERLLLLRDVLVHALDTFEGRENVVRHWLRTPIVTLNDQSPLQMMDTVTGFGLVDGVLYTTSTPELELVETLAHAPGVRYEDLPKYWLSSIEIPDDIRHFSRADLPAYWQDKTYGRTQYWLKDWLVKPDVLAVSIPSVIVPFSSNIILHPDHPLFVNIKLLAQEQIPIDRRLWRN